MTVVIGIIGLSFLVFFHELGHFLIARAMGVTVEAFSVGMGPVLLHHKKGATDYRISLIPLGGYCSMKGEKDYQKALEEGRSQIQGDPDSFYGVHPLKRLFIAFAGPMFNMIFAFIAFLIIALCGYTYITAGTTVQMTRDVPEYQDMTSPAYEAGMRSGDRIVSIDGKPMADFSEILTYISMESGKTISVEVERNGEILEINVQTELDKETGARRIGIVAMEGSEIEKNYGPYPFFPAIGEGLRQTFSMLSMTVTGIGRLFQGVDIKNAVSGPARVTTMLGSAVKEGFSEGFKIGLINTLELLALISISLFLTNLLPIPILDGGLILFALIEWIARRKMHPKVLYYIQIAGLVIVGCLVVLAVVGDIMYFVKK
ncbi:MAG: site-2 protease family protein [Treponema sp.]|nr:site-2 protease family protein [Treponema sp.]